LSEIVSQRRILRLWLPLAAMWLLMSLEQPTLSAVIARLPEPKLNLAAYGLTFALALIVESPVIMFLTLGTALARSRQAYQMLMRFTHIMAWGLTGLHLLLGLTPLYAWILAEIVGAPAEVIEPSRIAFLLMTPWTGAIAYRRMWQGVMIRYGRTQFLFVTTAIRLITTAAVALAGLSVGTIAGASVAGLAISAGVLADAAAAGVLVRPVVRQHLSGDRAGDFILAWPYLLRFYTPLAMTSLINLAAQPIVSLGLSRGPLPLESLAVWPVISGLTFLLRSGGVALQEVVVALLADQSSYQGLRHFSHSLALALTSIAALVTLTPLANLWFTNVAGLPADLAALARVPAALMVLVPALTVLTSWQRGVLVFFSRTGAITVATVINIVVLLAVVLAGVQTLSWPGAVTAALALTASLLAEVAYLTVQAHGSRRGEAWA
jgi:progressive ankylosis protein